MSFVVIALLALSPDESLRQAVTSLRAEVLKQPVDVVQYFRKSVAVRKELMALREGRVIHGTGTVVFGGRMKPVYTLPKPTNEQPKPVPNPVPDEDLRKRIGDLESRVVGIEKKLLIVDELVLDPLPNKVKILTAVDELLK